MWKFIASQDGVRKTGYLEGAFSLGLLRPPARLAEWAKSSWPWLPFHPGHFSGVFTHAITVRKEVMFIPKEVCSLLAIKAVDSSSSVNEPCLQCKRTACTEPIWATSYLPCGTGGEGNWCKYGNIYTICCARSNSPSPLTHEPYILCWHSMRH